MPSVDKPGIQAELTEQQVHYLFDVVRLSAGDSLVVTDGRGNQYRAELLSRNRRACEIIAPVAADAEAKVDVTLCLPLLKGNKLELVVQKAVELGVARIMLYQAQRSVVRPGNWDKKLERWKTIALAATQQCGRSRVPEISGLHSLDQLADKGQLALYAWEEIEGPGLQGYWQKQRDTGAGVVLLSGPEGGLDKEEVAQLDSCGFSPVTLGPRILRAETAALAMVACTMYALGQME